MPAQAESADQGIVRPAAASLTDEQIGAVLMVGYGYHREYDWRTGGTYWEKGWAFHKPNPLNDDSSADCLPCHRESM